MRRPFQLHTAALALATLIVLGNAVCAARASAQTRPDSIAPSAPVPTRGRLEIQLLASRSQLSAGTRVGITGTISNVGTDSTIYLTQASLTLTQPPELEGPLSHIRGFWAYFPNEAQVDAADKYLPADSVVVALVPGASAFVAWTASPSEDAADAGTGVGSPGLIGGTLRQVFNELRFLFFNPGDYRFSVQAKYWTDPARPPRAYHSTTQSMTIRVMAPQFVILLGAALGGLIAYIIFPMRRAQQVTVTRTTTSDTRFTSIFRAATDAQKKITAAFGAMLWSAIVTILLSRLAESQFLVRVTVNDFWGAIAIGLVAQYAGSKWLERLLPDSSGDQKSGDRAADGVDGSQQREVATTKSEAETKHGQLAKVGAVPADLLPETRVAAGTTATGRAGTGEPPAPGKT